MRMMHRAAAAGILAAAMFGPSAMANMNGTPTVPGSAAMSVKKKAAIHSLGMSIQTFLGAAEKWTSAHPDTCASGSCPGWNQVDDAPSGMGACMKKGLTPLAVHKAAGQIWLLYAGPSPSLCGSYAQAKAAAPNDAHVVDLTSLPGYLPPGFGTANPYAGEYCAAIVYDTGWAVGANSATPVTPSCGIATASNPMGRTSDVAVSTVSATYVAGVATMKTGPLAGVPANYALRASLENLPTAASQKIYQPSSNAAWLNVQ